MYLKSDRYPITIFFCLIWSLVGLNFILFPINDILRIIIVLPLIIFIPGYLLIYVLYPTKKTDKGIDDIQRIALSFGLSLVIVPLLGMGFYYTTRALTLYTILIGLGSFIFVVGILAICRWYQTPAGNRYTLKINLSIPKHETKLDKILTSVLIIFTVITVSLMTYVIITPKQEEHFTEFYILSSNHTAYNYPINLTIGENSTVILGVINHEKTTMNYTIEIWLSNQTTQFNSSTKMNETIYDNIWFKENITSNLTNLPPKLINLEELLTIQWEYNYTFNINQKGNYKMVFLLYTKTSQNYSRLDYYKLNKTIALEKVGDNTTAYRTVYLWINVK
jgi:uncharacterized membrane protein